MSGRAKAQLKRVPNPRGPLGKRAAHSKAASAAAALKRIVKGPSPFDLLHGRGAVGRGAALPDAVTAALVPWLVRSSGARAAASAESLRSACAALHDNAQAADSLHASSSAAPASHCRQQPAACAADDSDAPPPSTVTAAAAQVTAAAESSAKRSRAVLQRESHRATPAIAPATRTPSVAASASAAAVAARAASRAHRVERNDPPARLALALVIMGAVLFSSLAARARFAAIDSPTMRIDTGLRLPAATGSAAAAASTGGNMELDGGALQLRAGGARAVAAAAAEADARRLSDATGDVHDSEAVSVVTNGTESQSRIQSLLPASVPDLPEWQRTRGWMDQSRALAAAAFTVAFGAEENAAARRGAAVDSDAAMHGRCQCLQVLSVPRAVPWEPPVPLAFGLKPLVALRDYR